MTTANLAANTARFLGAVALFALMLGLFAGLIIGGAVLLAEGHFLFGFACWAAPTLWFWFVSRRSGLRDRNDFGI